MLKPYLDKLNLSASRIVEIDHDETLSAAVYRIDPGGILKIYWNKERFDRELHFLTFLQGKYPVPKILDNVSDEKHPAILMEYLDGLPIKDLGEKTAWKMGELLGKLHRIPQQEKCDPLAEMKSYLFRSLTECQGYLSQDLLTKTELFFESQVPLLKEVDAPCIVHRDFKPGNLVAQNGDILGVIDWENARITFAEEDFTQMELLYWEKDPSTRKPFMEGYQSVRSLPNVKEMMPLLKVLKSLGAIGFTLERGTWGTTHTSIYATNLERLKTLI